MTSSDAFRDLVMNHVIIPAFVKYATDSKHSDTNYFKFLIKQLLSFKSAMIKLDFDKFFNIFADLVAEIKVSKLQMCS